jgi:hypothetical protein
MIADDAFHAHKETKKRKVVATLSGSAPPKYQMVYHLDSCTSTITSTSISIRSSSKLPAHLSASTSGQHLRL